MPTLNSSCRSRTIDASTAPAKSNPLTTEEEVWYRALLANVEPVQLPQQFSDPIESGRMIDLSHLLPDSLWKQLQLTAENMACDIETLCLTGWQVLLSRYTQSEDLAIAIDNRFTQIESGGLPAPTVLRQSMSLKSSMREWVQQTRHSLNTLKLHGARSLSDLDDLLDDKALYTQLEHYTTLFHQSDLDKAELENHALAICLNTPPDQTAQLTLSYQSNLFESDDLGLLIGHYLQLLGEALDDIDKSVDQLAILTGQEFQRVVHDFNNRSLPYDEDKDLVELFEEQAARRSDHIAVACAESSLSYSELAEQVARMATWLLQFDLQPDDLVSICLPRNTKLLVTQLAVQKVGAAYLPVDPRYPQDRIDHILNDASAKLFITDSSFQIDSCNASSKQFYLDEEWSHIQATPIREFQTNAKPDHLAYVIYTSGSTGKPKGVEITRKNLINQLTAAHQVPPVDEDDVFIAITTVAFDISIVELFLPLIIGAKVYIASSDTASDGFELKSLLVQEKITRLDTTPSTFRLLLEAGWQGDTSLIGQVGGEALSVDLAKSLIPKLKTFWNSYGPTEATVSCTAAQIVDPEQPVTIGTPLPNYRIYILEPNGQPCPVNVPGEICVSGDSTARGYLGREDLNQEKFINDPFLKDGTRMYRTGDVGRWLPDGTIDCIGRMDNQIKLRGYRIELGEIETLIAAHADINHAAVILHKSDDSEFLAAYVVPEDAGKDTASTTASIEDSLSDALPTYMIPGSFTFIDALPVTPNGKVDLKRLPEPTLREHDSSANVQLLTDTEKTIASLWEELIGIPNIDRADNFFEVGGHSLLAMKFINQAGEIFNRTISTRSLITSSLSNIAEMLNPDDKAVGSTEPRPLNQDTFPMFLPSGNQQLFACLHGDANSEGHPPILICQPLGHEYQRLHRAVRLLASRLVASGRQVLRFDYAGTGDSAGELEDQTVEVWQRNISDMASWLCQQTDSEAIDVIGIRMGGPLLASTVNLNGSKLRLNRLLLWDPVYSGQNWLDTANQMTCSAMRNLDRFPVRLSDKNSREFFGYSYSTEQIQALSELMLADHEDSFPADTEYVVSDLASSGSSGLSSNKHQVTHIDDNQRWTDFAIADDIAITPQSSQFIVDWFNEKS